MAKRTRDGVLRSLLQIFITNEECSMKKLWIMLLLAGLAFTVPATVTAAEESYTIDPFHTYPNFKIDHLGFSMMYGRFGKTTGSMKYDHEKKTGSIEITIDATSLDTGMKRRDDHLRSPDFLNTVEFRTITFKADNVKLKKNGTGKIKGMLTMAGTTRAVTLHVERSHCGIFPFDPTKKKFVCGFDARTKIKRSDFSVNYGLPAIGDDMELMFEIEAVRD